MSRTIYFVSGSPFAWRVMLAMGLKNLEYDAKLLSGSDGDTKKPEFLALNPRGKVPVLVDGEITVYESIAILAYLNRTYPETSLFGESPADAARIWQRLMEVENYLGTAFVGAFRPLFTQTFEGKEDEINEHFASIGAEIKTASGWLTGNDYMTGDRPSAVDVTLYPALAMFRRVGPTLSVPGIKPNLPNFDADYPTLAAWMKRIEALPGFDAAYPPHWRDTA